MVPRRVPVPGGRHRAVVRTQVLVLDALAAVRPSSTHMALGRFSVSQDLGPQGNGKEAADCRPKELIHTG